MRLLVSTLFLIGNIGVFASGECLNKAEAIKQIAELGWETNIETVDVFGDNNDFWPLEVSLASKKLNVGTMAPQGLVFIANKKPQMNRADIALFSFEKCEKGEMKPLGQTIQPSVVFNSPLSTIVNDENVVERYELHKSILEITFSDFVKGGLDFIDVTKEGHTPLSLSLTFYDDGTASVTRIEYPTSITGDSDALEIEEIISNYNGVNWKTVREESVQYENDRWGSFEQKMMAPACQKESFTQSFFDLTAKKEPIQVMTFAKEVQENFPKCKPLN